MKTQVWGWFRFLYFYYSDMPSCGSYLHGHQNSGDSCLDVSWPSVNSHRLVLCSPPLQKTASASDGVGISCSFLKTSSHRRAPAGSVSFFFFFLPRPFRRDMWIGVDLQTRPPDPLLKQSGLDFTRDLPPSSPHASETDWTPCWQRAAGRLPKDQLTSISAKGKKGKREIKYWILFIFFGRGGGSLFLEKGRK